MTQTLSSEFDDLRTALSGRVIAPGDPDYDQARAVWNAEIDRRPSVIARRTSTTDVAAALGWAARHSQPVSVRGGAHNVAGTSVADDALMIDLSLMREVVVDPEARRARVGGGALLADLDAAAQAHGLAVPVGVIGHTGVAGITLGGGMGWLTRKHGLTTDNLVSAEVVLADGRIVHASADEHPDLFWALRGGGGNFGVVTGFEFTLHPVHPMVEFALLFWPLEQGTEVLRLARDVLADLPDELNIIVGALNAPPEPFVPEEHHFAPGYALLVTGFGADVGTEHARLVARLRDALPPLFDMAAPMPYVALQQMLDEANAWGSHAYVKNTYITGLSDPVIGVMTEHVPRKTSPTSLVLIYPLDGAYSSVGEDETAFGGGRSPRSIVFIVGYTPDPEVLPAERAWVREFHSAMAPLGIGRETYVNELPEPDDDKQLRDAYGREKYERLARVKADYDPGNVFNSNTNIKPA
ncbi:MAG: FAD-binding oxidoreductase [Pseudonocardia sp.]|nr:FAD-binding oxidoreductase [Pseudonocardia sp.]